MAFDPSKYMMKISGRDYLPVAARLLWFREDHPDWTIQTCVHEINHEKQYAVFRADICDERGRVLATGTKFENRAGFADYIEKAESGSVGRALLMLGYGTANALDEISEGLRLADAPFPPSSPATQGNGSTSKTAKPAGRAAAPPAEDEPLATPDQQEEIRGLLEVAFPDLPARKAYYLEKIGQKRVGQITAPEYWELAAELKLRLEPAMAEQPMSGIQPLSEIEDLSLLNDDEIDARFGSGGKRQSNGLEPIGKHLAAIKR